MTQAKQGDTVKVHYTGKLDDGTIFDTSSKREPLEFKLGDKMIIPGFEEAVEGMNVGETKTCNIPMDKAYGPRMDELVIDIGRDKIPENLDPEVGQQLEMRNANGQAMIVKVVEISNNSIKLDANHPLAGKALTFEINLVEIS